MAELATTIISDRRKWALGIAKLISIIGYKYLAHPVMEIHEDFPPLRNKNSVFFFAGLHKSLWETSGILAGLYLNLDKFEIPYAGMGDNLVRGKFFQSLAKKIGIFLVKRVDSRKGILESAKLLKDFTFHLISRGKDVMVFPEGTRKNIVTQGSYGQFFPTVFEALLEYEKNKENILAADKDLKPYDAYIIPTNVDYSKIREDKEMLADHKKPRTLHVLDSLKMVRHIRETHISIGKPIRVADHLEKSRKELAAYTRERCIELVKILPINVVSQAIVDSATDDRLEIGNVEENIRRTMQKLAPFSDHFRGFSPDDPPASLLEKVAGYESTFKPKYIHIGNLDFYRLYANYIGHYYTQGDSFR